MRYFKINTLGDTKNPKLVMLRSRPEGLGIHDYCLAMGEPIGDRYPDDARIQIPATSKGIVLSSLIGNTQNCLMVKADVKDVIAAHCADQEIEYLPFTLYDRKGRPMSPDCWIVNPIGTFDCVDRDASEVRWVDDTKQEVSSVRKYVFRAKKLEKAPHLFRVPEEVSHYFVSQTLARAFKDRQFTNVLLLEIETR